MYSRLIENLTKRLTLALPSALAHDALRAIPIGEGIPKIEHKTPPRAGSVLILLYEVEGSIKFPLIKRPEYNGIHSGQISLPGGKGEHGEDAIETALRECEEEIGIPAHVIKVIGRLSEFYVIPSNVLVTPVVATLTSNPSFVPDPYEVVRIIKGDVYDLMKSDAVRTTEILATGKYRMQAPYFEIENEIVWGATAMMLNEFRLVMQEIGLK